MRPRHPRVPTIWLMTDERMGEALWPALERLPRGAGVVIRHYRTDRDERRRLAARIARVARRRGLVLVRAGGDRLPGERGVHHGRGRPGALRTAAAHDAAEARRAVRRGARVLFVSPVFATRSHPGARALGPARAARIGRGYAALRIALGGMTARRFGQIERLSFAGWAAIDAWMPRQKWKAVPI